MSDTAKYGSLPTEESILPDTSRSSRLWRVGALLGCSCALIAILLISANGHSPQVSDLTSNIRWSHELLGSASRATRSRMSVLSELLQINATNESMSCEDVGGIPSAEGNFCCPSGCDQCMELDCSSTNSTNSSCCGMSTEESCGEPPCWLNMSGSEQEESLSNDTEATNASTHLCTENTNVYSMSVGCWLMLHKDPEDIEDWLKDHSILSTENWYKHVMENPKLRNDFDDWFEEHKNTDGFHISDWLEKHGIRRQDKAVHGRLEILAQVASSLSGRRSGKCGMVCWLSQFRNVQILRSWPKAKKEENLKFLLHSFPKLARYLDTEEWYSKWKNYTPSVRKWYEEHKNYGVDAEQYYQQHKNYTPSMSKWYEEHKNYGVDAEQWYQEHKDYLPDAEVWYQAHRADPQILLSTLEEILLWESVKSLEARALRKRLERKFASIQRHSVLQQTTGNSSAGSGPGQFDLSQWLNEHHEFDVDAWLKEQQEFPNISDGNGSSVEVRDLSEWLDAQVSFDLDDWLSHYPDPEDLDAWLANTSSSSGFNVSGWLDDHPLFDVEEWIAKQEGNRSGAFNMSGYLDEQPSLDVSRWLEEQPVYNVDDWLKARENASDAFKMSQWLDEHKEVDISKWLQAARAQTSSSQVLLNRRQARRAAKTAIKQRSMKMQLQQGGNSTARSAFDLNAWLAAQPNFDLEEWLANHSGGDGNSSISLPEEDAAEISPNGLCCCGFACEEISASCCGAWYPAEKQMAGSKLAQRKGARPQELETSKRKAKVVGSTVVASREKAGQVQTSQKMVRRAGKFASLADMGTLRTSLSDVMRGFRRELDGRASRKLKKVSHPAVLALKKRMSMLEASANSTQTANSSTGSVGGDLQFGARIHFGDGMIFGNNISFGQGDKFGKDEKFGNFNKFARHSEFGSKDKFGDNNQFGEETSFGDDSELGNSNQVGAGSKFAANAQLGDDNSIGANVTFGSNARLGARNQLADHVAFSASLHAGPENSFGPDADLGSKADLGPSTKIGAGARLGAGVSIGAGSEIGDGATLGEVSKDKEEDDGNGEPASLKEQVYKPDPGSGFVRKGSPELESNGAGRNYWPVAVSDEQEEKYNATSTEEGAE